MDGTLLKEKIRKRERAFEFLDDGQFAVEDEMIPSGNESVASLAVGG